MKLNLFGGEGVGKKDQRDFKVLEKKKNSRGFREPLLKVGWKGG